MVKIKTIGVMTSGGDAPGMNAAIRAVTRAGIYNGFNIKGIYRGYDGLINDEIKTFSTENVSGIIGTGGTILKTARSKEFMTEEGREKAYEVLKKEEIDALIVIGGNGSLTGAMNFARDYDVCCIGLPGTIDNDLYGTDNTIGYDTTMNTIVECVDRIRDTAQSHERIFFVEVMGRDAGFLAQTALSLPVRKQPLSQRTLLTWTNWRNSWHEESVSRRRAVLLLCLRVPSVARFTMRTVYVRNSLSLTCVSQSLAICNVEAVQLLVIAFLRQEQELVLWRLLYRDNATSWWECEITKWSMFRCLRLSAQTNHLIANSSRYSTN